MAFAPQTAACEPFSELNTTPLIDVLLVLLVMFILSIPVANHALEFDLPASRDDPATRPILKRNLLTIDAAGTIRWNGQPTSEAGLLATLQQAVNQPREPLVLFQPDGAAPYNTSARVLRIVKASGLGAFAFSGLEQFQSFAAPPPR